MGDDEFPYDTRTVMVAAREGHTLHEIAAAFGVEVVRNAGRSGYGAIAVPEDTTMPDFVASLRADGRANALPNARVEATGQANEAQWHLTAVDAADGNADFGGWVVAVIDTGVAYENHTDASGTYVAEPSFAETTFLSGYDFVNGDSHANDDNGHGTHIASLITSTGAIEGVAPRAWIMPLKVLDAGAGGTEIDLINAIYHAVDNGAHVINMSLAYLPAYTPSPALTDALKYADTNDVTMVGAAGNSGIDGVAWPAASPLVITVGATHLHDDYNNAKDYPNGGAAWYSNRVLASTCSPPAAT